MTDPPPPSVAPTPLDGGRPPSIRAAGKPPRLLDLIDVETLQAIQDGFAELVQMAMSIRDEQGRLVTQPSHSSRFCNLVGGPLHDNEACCISNYAAAAAAASEGRSVPVRYVCHAGLAQFAAAIHLDGRILGTVVLGDVPERPFQAEEVRELARKYAIDEAALVEAAAELEPVDERQMRAASAFLQLLANTITRLCWQQAVLSERIDELTLLARTSHLLSSTLDPDSVLDNIVKTMAEVMQVKACTLRLLTPNGKELVVEAAYGLSGSYLDKGPVLVAENPNDRAALGGKIITVQDMRTDPHVRYGDAARTEGIVSSLSVGLIAKGEPLGTLHIYTAQPHTFTPEEIRLFRSVADQAALTVHNAQLVEECVIARQQQRELEVAARVQERMLPAKAPDIQGYDCYGVTVPSLMVGGDFHDWIRLPRKNWGVAVGDGAGQGGPAGTGRTRLRPQPRHGPRQPQPDRGDRARRVRHPLLRRSGLARAAAHLRQRRP
jgi:ligand-binding sensor protein